VGEAAGKVGGGDGAVVAEGGEEEEALGEGGAEARPVRQQGGGRQIHLVKTGWSKRGGQNGEVETGRSNGVVKWGGQTGWSNGIPTSRKSASFPAAKLPTRPSRESARAEPSVARYSDWSNRSKWSNGQIVVKWSNSGRIDQSGERAKQWGGSKDEWSGGQMVKWSNGHKMVKW
jgi:hypothetical protein